MKFRWILWYFPQDIQAITDYKYVLDIVDHFSKWIWSYPLKKNWNRNIKMPKNLHIIIW